MNQSHMGERLSCQFFHNFCNRTWLSLGRSREPYTHLILSNQYSRERTVCLWFRPIETNQQTKNIFLDPAGFPSVYRPISFKLGMMIETTRLFILIPVLMTLSFIQGHSCMKSKFFALVFSQISLSVLMKFSKLPQPFSWLKFILNSFCVIGIQGKDFLHDFIRYIFNYIIGLCWDTYKPICFEVSMVLFLFL